MFRTASRSLLVAVACGGCAGQQSVPLAAPGGSLSLAEAQRIVEEFEASQPQRVSDNPLSEPDSLDDVLEILRSDQIDLFGRGIMFARSQEGPRARALHAQIELAWGEAQLILAEILWEVSGEMHASARRLAMRVATGAKDDLEELAELRRSARHTAAVAQALPRLAAVHVGTGAELARAIIRDYPDNYLGYRVAADYYHLREDWERFDEMVRKIEERKQDSIGLIFLRGAAALRRHDDKEQAAYYFRQALVQDPRFGRAQAQLVLAQPTIEDTLEEFKKLKALNPHHQIVTWAGDMLEKVRALRRRQFQPPVERPDRPPHE